MTDRFRGFELFNDIEDRALRTRNRAVVLSNMYCDNAKKGRAAPVAAAQLLGYFGSIPEWERQEVQQEFVRQMQERGYKL